MKYLVDQWLRDDLYADILYLFYFFVIYINKRSLTFDYIVFQHLTLWYCFSVTAWMKVFRFTWFPVRPTILTTPLNNIQNCEAVDFFCESQCNRTLTRALLHRSMLLPFHSSWQNILYFTNGNLVSVARITQLRPLWMLYTSWRAPQHEMHSI